MEYGIADGGPAPLVTVYLPTCNRIDLLKRSLKSVLTQELEGLECIVVDDGSVDGTSEYLEQLKLTDKRLRIIRNEIPQGAAVARNQAIFLARGFYITGIDDDDYIKSSYLRELISIYTADCACVFLRPFSFSDILFSPLITIRKKVSYGQLKFFNIIGNQVFTETTKLKCLGGFDETFPAKQDYDLWLRLLSAYGVGKFNFSSSHIIDAKHTHKRISDSSKNKAKGLKKILEKNSELSSLATASVNLRRRLSGERIMLRSYVTAIIDPRNLRSIFLTFKEVIGCAKEFRR